MHALVVADSCNPSTHQVEAETADSPHIAVVGAGGADVERHMTNHIAELRATAQAARHRHKGGRLDLEVEEHKNVHRAD